MKRTPIRRPFAIWWWCVALATIATFTLSIAAFPSYLARPTGEDPFTAAILLESVYRSLQLFVLSGDSLTRPIPWPLQISRFLAAFVALSTVILALCHLFRERLRLLLLRHSRDHVVMCGLGQRGVELVRDLREQRRKVVVVEGQEDHPDLAGCQALGATILIGSPADSWVLAQARVDRADVLLSLFQEDAASIETLMWAHHLNVNRAPGSLRCILQIFDHELRRLLDKNELFKNHRTPVKLELFNLFDIGAQLMLRESPALFRQGEPRRLLIVGMGWLGQMLLQRVMRAWQIDRLAKQQEKAQGRPEPTGLGWKLETVEVIIIDRDCRDLESRLAANGLMRKEDFHLTICEMDVQGNEFLAGKFVPPHDTGNTIDAAFVCLPDDRLALLTAVRLRDRFGPTLPLVIRMTSRSGGAELLTSYAMEEVHIVGLLDLASTMPLVTNATLEMIAREIHRDYVLDQLAHGQTPQTNSALVPWHMLDDGLKESNRQAAVHIDAKLKEIGCEKYPVKTIETLYAFAEKELEFLAKEEHERWCEERRRAGWKFGPVKDVNQKVSPFLTSFDELPEGTKESNRTAIRRIPVWLAKAGFAIRRLAT